MAQAAVPKSNRTVETIRGQYHKFMLIPLIEHHCRWFDAGPVSIAVEARALGDSPERMVRGPSIQVFNAARSEEYLRFDVFGKVLHYHYIHNDVQHNTHRQQRARRGGAAASSAAPAAGPHGC